MRLPLFLLAFAVVFAARGEDDCRCWMPASEDISVLEAKIGGRSLPLGSLDRYARYYAGTILNDGHRIIRGKLVPAGADDAPGIHVVEGRMPPFGARDALRNPIHGRTSGAPPPEPGSRVTSKSQNWRDCSSFPKMPPRRA